MIIADFMMFQYFLKKVIVLNKKAA